MAIFTGMRSADAVTSSWAVIWKQPSPSMAQTVARACQPGEGGGDGDHRVERRAVRARSAVSAPPMRPGTGGRACGRCGRRPARQRGVHRVEHRVPARWPAQVLGPHVDPDQPTAPGRAGHLGDQHPAPPRLGRRPASARRCSPEARKPSTRDRSRPLVGRQPEEPDPGLVGQHPEALLAQRLDGAGRGEPARRHEHVGAQAEPGERAPGGDQPEPGLVPGQRGELGAPAAPAAAVPAGLRWWS